jgi:hypothetical protein
MKTSIFIFLLFFGLSIAAIAAIPENVTLRVGQEKRVAGGELKVKMVAVTEDSRCPVGTTCVWAGNAKIKVQITGKRGSKIFEFNTTMGPKGDSLEGWSVMLDSLTPVPRAGHKTDTRSYIATFTITRLQR